MDNHVKITVSVIAGVTLILISAMMTYTLTRPLPCASNRVNFPKKEQWDAHETKEFPEFGVKILRTLIGERCYMIPKMPAAVNNNEGQMMKVIPDLVSVDLLQHLAGAEAVEFCKGHSTYAVTPMQGRHARQANNTEVKANADHGPDNFINALPNECQNNVIIQCELGVKESCTSGLGVPGFGGIYKVETTCVNPTEFKAKIVTRCKESEDTKADRLIKCMSKFSHKAEVALINIKKEREHSG